MDEQSHSQRLLPVEAARRILVFLPDDGADLRLIAALRRDKGVTRASTVAVRAVAALQEAASRPGRLPESTLARLVTVLSSAREADELFDYVCAVASIGRPGGGIVLMQRLAGATAFLLPEGLPDEAG